MQKGKKDKSAILNPSGGPDATSFGDQQSSRDDFTSSQGGEQAMVTSPLPYTFLLL